MDTERMKHTAEWFYSNVFHDEELFFRKQEPKEELPSLLRAARSLATEGDRWQSREALFIKQGKLLVDYEDDYEFDRQVIHYFPTYEALTNQELRGYFSWRTKLRQGVLQKTALTFAFLYVYEIINQIGVESPQDGYNKLLWFQEEYSQLDPAIYHYTFRWLQDYVIYYGLDASLLENTYQVRFDRALTILDTIDQRSSKDVMEAIRLLAEKWLERCRFYRSHPEDMEAIFYRVLLRMTEHNRLRCKKSFVEQYFGILNTYQVRLFESAVFTGPLKNRDVEYPISERTIYRCKGRLWTVTILPYSQAVITRFTDLLKTIDSLMRKAYDGKYPVKQPVETKWIVKLIQEEIQKLLTEKQEAEAKKITIDYSQLNRIRRDAAATQEKLAIADEIEEEPPAPVMEEKPEEAPPVDTPLSPPEYRLLQCLLYGKGWGWVRSEGYILSVLSDSINDKLYDIFQDSVMDDSPALVEDYIDELKEMVMP